LLNIAEVSGAQRAARFFRRSIFEFSRLRVRSEILNFFAALSP
jgi:hypothetical protein